MKKTICLLLSLGIYFSVSAQKKWTLQECVEYAMEHNLQVKQNEYNKQIQEKSYQMAKNQYLPTVGASVSNNASFGQRISQEGLINRTDNFNNSLFLGASIQVFNNGRIQKQARQANYDVEASLYDLQTVKNNIALQIAQQYLNILLNREIVKINESAVENAQQNFDKAKKTTEVGKTALTVQYEAEAQLAQEKQNLKNAQIEEERALFLLAQLLQLPDYKDFDVENYTITSISPTLNLEEDILTKAFESQPEIHAAESRIKSAETATDVARTSFWPTISATAGIGTSYYSALHKNVISIPDENGNIIEATYSDPPFFQQYKDNFSQQLGISANIPIFNKGITKLQVEQAKINEDIAQNNLAQQKQQVKEKVQQAVFDVEANYQKYLAAQEAVKSTELALDFAQKSFDAGKSTIYDLNVARNNYVNSQGAVAQAKYNYLFSQKLMNFYAGIPLEL